MTGADGGLIRQSNGVAGRRTNARGDAGGERNADS